MTAMGTVLIQQLLELFPHIEEEFIFGLYDAYKEDNPDLDEMVEIVFSYDYPPLKKLTNDTNELQTEEYEELRAHSDNLSVDVDSKIDEGRALREDELMVCSSRAINTDETNIQIFQQNHNETVGNCSTNIIVESCDNNINDTLEYPNTRRDPISSIMEEINQTINEYPGKFDNLLIDEECDENKNISENEVKLLFFELPFRNNNYFQSQLNNVLLEERILDSTNEIQSKDNHKLPEDKGSFNNELNSEVISASLVTNTESNPNDLFLSKSKISQADSRSGEEPCSFNSGPVPVLIPNQSKTTALCTSSLAAYESSSPDPTESSKTALLGGLEILHEKQTNPTCVGAVSLSKTETGVKDTRPLGSPFNTPESKCSLLRKIFPDADAEYLLCQCENFSNSDELLLFISKNIDDKMYPKRRESVECAPEVLGFDCTIEDFLQYIPDPTAEFQSDQYVRTDYKENAEIYLKSR